jgi:hypothetical protein
MLIIERRSNWSPLTHASLAVHAALNLTDGNLRFYFPELRIIDQFFRPNPSRATPVRIPQIEGDSIFSHNKTAIAKNAKIQ